MKGQEDWPDWLPDGWITGSKRNDGRVDRFYRSPVSGSTFYSKEDVLRYLNFEKVDGLPPRTTGFVYSISEHDDPEVVTQEDSPLWLPDGWILEIKTRKTGPKAGNTYKCYFDPSNGRRFYSKKEVFRYIMGEQKSTENRSVDSESSDDILAQVDCSTDGILPPGWIRETRYKRKNSSQMRKDSYYKDPVSGYVFRSKNDAIRFVETGEVSRHAFRSKGISIDTKYMVDESPPPITARSLRLVYQRQFSSPTSITSNRSVEEPSFVKSSHKTQVTGIENSVTSSLSLPPACKSGNGKVQVNTEGIIQIYECSRMLDVSMQIESEKEEEMIPEKTEVARTLSGSFNEEIYKQSDASILEMVHGNQMESQNKTFFELKQGEIINPPCVSENCSYVPSNKKLIKKMAIRRSSGDEAKDESIAKETNGDSFMSSDSERQQPENNSSVDLPPDISSDIASSSIQSMNLSATGSTTRERHVDINISNKLVNDKTFVSEGQSSQLEDENHSKTQVKNKSQPEGAPCKQPNKSLSITADEICNMVNTKRVTRSSCRSPLGNATVISSSTSKVTAAHETSSTPKSPRGVIMKGHLQYKSHPGSSSEISAKRTTRTCRGSPSDAIQKHGTSIDQLGSSSKVSAKRETRSSFRGSLSDLRKKDKISSSRQRSLTAEEDTKTLSLSRRASKRLAGLEPGPASDLVSYRSLKKIKHATDLGDGPADGPAKVDIKSKDPVEVFNRPGELEIPPGTVKERQEKVVGKDDIVPDTDTKGESSEATKTETVNKESSSLASPFGDTWPDPCIEFAFRTLIGDIPVFEDPSTTTINYYQEPDNTTIDRRTILNPTLRDDLNPTQVKE